MLRGGVEENISELVGITEELAGTVNRLKEEIRGMKRTIDELKTKLSNHERYDHG
jgi:predicted RNase H-like nuclease (RuvC/YqgF family)